MEAFITDALNFTVTYTEGDKDDAKAYAQSQIEKFFEIPSRSFFRISKFSQGFIVELQEGGSGLSHLDEVLKHLEGEHGGVEVITQNHKKVRVVLSEEGFPVTQVLPDKTLEDDFNRLPDLPCNQKMTFFFSHGRSFYKAGAAVMWSGIAVLIAGVISMGANRFIDESIHHLANSAGVSLWDIATLTSLAEEGTTQASPASRLNMTYTGRAKREGIEKMYLTEDGQWRIEWGSAPAEKNSGPTNDAIKPVTPPKEAK